MSRTLSRTSETRRAISRLTLIFDDNADDSDTRNYDLARSCFYLEKTFTFNAHILLQALGMARTAEVKRDARIGKILFSSKVDKVYQELTKFVKDTERLALCGRLRYPGATKHGPPKQYDYEAHTATHTKTI